jgi:hypothetical protein
MQDHARRFDVDQIRSAASPFHALYKAPLSRADFTGVTGVIDEFS